MSACPLRMPVGFSVAYRDRLLSRWDEAFLAYLVAGHLLLLDCPAFAHYPNRPRPLWPSPAVLRRLPPRRQPTAGRSLDGGRSRLCSMNGEGVEDLLQHIGVVIPIAIFHGYLRLIIPIAIVFWKEPQYYPDHDIRRGWGRRIIRNAKESSERRYGIARKRLRYTQTELAKLRCGHLCSSQLEGGKPTAQLEKAIRVANRVGLDLEFRERG